MKSTVLLFLLAVLRAGPAHAVLVTLTATGTPGSYKTGSVDASGTKNDGDMTGIADFANRGWAVFDLSGIPSGAVINSVTAKFTTFGSTTSPADNYLGGFTGNPATLTGASLYAQLNATVFSSFSTFPWTTSPALNSLPFNSSGISFITASAGMSSVVISYVRGAASTYNLSGYGAAAGAKPELVIDYTLPTACTGIPAPGVTQASATAVCPSQQVTLTLPGIAPGTGGLTYQWQSSLNGTTFTNVTGATGSAYFTPLTANTWFRCSVTCTASGQTTTSGSVSVLLNSFSGCYCASGASSTADDDIGQVSMGALVNPLTVPAPLQYNNSANATYTDYTNLPPVSFFRGATYPVSIQQMNLGSYYTCYAKIFIDLNQNGNLTDPGEEVFGGQTTNISGNGADPLTGNVIIPLTAAPGQTLMRVVLAESGSPASTGPCTTYTWGETEDYLINIVQPAPCTGATAGSTASTDSSVCSTDVFNLSLPTSVFAGNITYQWQSSPDNLIWTNIAGAVNSFWPTSQSANTWYRCLVTCVPVGVTDTSVPLEVQMNSFLSCYCNSGANFGWDEDIFEVTFNNVTTTSDCSTLAPGPNSVMNQYSNYTTATPIPCNIGTAVTFSVEVGSCGWASTNGVKIYIDYNRNGDLTDPGEEAFFYAGNGTYSFGGVIVIPVSAQPGVTLMRVVAENTFFPAGITPCGTFSSGETEDYLIDLILPPPCAGAVAGNTASTDSLVCSGQSFTLSLPNTIVWSNLSYQWQISQDSLVWADIAGANNIVLITSQTDSAYYRCVVVCTTAGVADTSDVLKVAMAPFLDCYCTSGATDTWGTDIGQVVVGGFANPAVTPPLNGPDVDTYTDFTALGLLQVTRGGVAPMSVAQIVQFSTPAAVTVYIDLDHSGTYDPGEDVFNGNTFNGNPVSGMALIPMTAQLGLTGMRVILEDYGSNPADPCMLYSTGETEDYRVNIVPPIPLNGQMVAIYNPNTGCGLTSCEDLSFEVRNAGSDSLSVFGYTYTVNGTPFVVPPYTLASPAAPGDVFMVVVPCGLDLSTPGNYTVQITLQVPGDTDPQLDVMSKSIFSIPTISTFPYIEHFDNPAFPSGGWIPAAAPSSPGSLWALGTPAKGVINSAASAPNSWATGLTNINMSNEGSYVESPCLDFTTLANPIFEMNAWWEMDANSAGAALLASTDGGVTWVPVGGVGSGGQNWYNTTSSWWSLQSYFGANDGWSGDLNDGSGGWVKAIHKLSGLGFEPNVKLRIVYASGWASTDGFAFDDVKIYDTPANDVGATAITSPVSGTCGDASTAVTVVIKNTGMNLQTSIPVSVSYNNGAGSQGVISTTYTTTLLPDSSATVVVGSFNSLMGGNYTLTAWTLLTTDGLRLNDTTRTTVFINHVPAAPLGVSMYKCMPDTFHLAVAAPVPGKAYTWYDALTGGTQLDTGTVFVTPNVISSTTYYVSVQEEAGFLINTPMSGGSGTLWSGYIPNGLEFTNTYPMTLDSVTIYPTGPGDIQLMIMNPLTGQIIGTGVTTTITASSGPVRIPVDIYVPASGSGVYHLMASPASTVPDLNYYWSAATFPYTAGGVSITENTDGSGQWGSYYFYYDWKVTTLGCPSERTPVTAGIYPKPVVNLGPDYAGCYGQTLNPGNIWPTMNWLLNNTNIGSGPTIFAGVSGTYHLFITDGNGCTGKDSVQVLIDTAPQVELGNDTTVCGLLTLNAGNPGLSFAWSCNAAPSFTQTLPVAITGTYCVTVTNLSGCQSVDSIHVTVTPAPLPNLGNDIQTCKPVVLGPSSPAPGITCSWALPGGGTSNNCTVTASAGGTYVLTQTDAKGCAGSDDVVVTFKTPPVVNLGADADTVCNAKVLNAGTQPGCSFLWLTPGGSATSQSVTASKTGKYKVVVTSNIGCTGSDSVQMVINTAPVQPSIVVGYTGQPFEYIFTAAGSLGVGNTYVWTITNSAGGVTTVTGNPVMFLGPRQIDFYEVGVTVTNDCGTASSTIALLATGTEEGLNASVSVYPNPTDGIAWVDLKGLEEAVRLTLYDANGRILLSRSLSTFEMKETVKLDLSEFAKGTYLMRFDTGQGTVTRKITLQ